MRRVLKTPARYMRVYLVGSGFAVLALLLFGSSARPPDQIATVIALPLMVFVLLVLLLGLLIIGDETLELFKASLKQSSSPLRAIVLGLGASGYAAASGICILLCLPAYHLLGFDWALKAAAKTAAALILVGGLFPAGFFGGLYAADTKYNKILEIISDRLRHPPFRHAA